jgi:hypothetical protein
MARDVSARPYCCGQPMREVTEADERLVDIRAWLCDRCKWETQTLPCYEDNSAPTNCPTSRSAGKHARDPRLFGIRPKARRYEVRVAGGSSGLWRYVGMTATLQEAVQLRDAAKASAGDLYFAWPGMRHRGGIANRPEKG